jgi:hypothetical protein
LLLILEPAKTNNATSVLVIVPARIVMLFEDG